MPPDSCLFPSWQFWKCIKNEYLQVNKKLSTLKTALSFHVLLNNQIKSQNMLKSPYCVSYAEENCL
jgi:hypothetical protein